jgi:hopene-associated glycosyltransferase HpnB
VWALEQGIASAGTPDYLLLTDADIVHVPGSLRALVADAEAGSLDLTSRLARLHCRSLAERLVIPPFVFFFNVLYPMPRVNDPRSRKAAAAGGCVLVRRAALDAAGGVQAIRAELIDDVNLARLLKSSGRRIRLAISRGDVRSIRRHTFRSGWRMVRRTAFDELGYSYPRLAATLAGLVLLFAVPPGLVALALGGFGLSPGWRVALGLLGASGWAASAIAYLPAIRLYGLGRLWTITLPLSGLLYGGMTLDSAARHLRSDAPAEW